MISRRASPDHWLVTSEFIAISSFLDGGLRGNPHLSPGCDQQITRVLDYCQYIHVWLWQASVSFV